jgi:hypothetical protein
VPVTATGKRLSLSAIETTEPTEIDPDTGTDTAEPLASPDPAARLAACEHQLRSAGLPLFIHDYSAAEDIFTRAAPFLAVVALFEISGAVNANWSLGANLAAFLGGAVLLLVLFGVFNLVRGRPVMALPKHIGVAELSAFVLLPSLLPVVFGTQFASAVGTAVTNLVILGLVWLVVGFGLLSIVRWASARLFAQLAASLTLMVRALPLIIFFGLISFFTAEIWQMFSTVPTVRYAAAIVLFFVIGLLFLSMRLPTSVREVQDQVDLAGVPLSRFQQINLALVILVSQCLQILLVALLVWLFFAVFGALLVDVQAIETWTALPPDRLWHFDLFGEEVVVTSQLLRSSLGIGAFAGLYYTVAMLVDATYRDEFMSELIDQMRSTFHIRSEYLELVGKGA